MSAARDLAVPAGNAPLRIFAQQWFSRVAGAPLTEGNAIELLIDARANFDAWLAAIATAQDSVLFENYIWGDDEVSHAMVAALASRAKDGVRVRVVRDGLGCLGVSRMKLFRPLQHIEQSRNFAVAVTEFPSDLRSGPIFRGHHFVNGSR